MRPRPEPAGPGQESVWDYPRPPRLESTTALLEVVLGGVVVASTRSGWRVLETSHPPTYYLPRAAFADDVLRPTGGASWCEWKGQASYFDLTTPTATATRAAWTYDHPTRGFEALAGAVAVMAAAVEECRVDGEVVTPQPGAFYGGWITASVVGPFKGVPGSSGW
jgi:uncharacterized protein (DUF427 family)